LQGVKDLWGTGWSTARWTSVQPVTHRGLDQVNAFIYLCQAISYGKTKPLVFEPKAQPNVIYYPYEFSHEIESARAYLYDLPAVDNFGTFSCYRQIAMAAFTDGFRKFTKVPTISPVAEAPQRFEEYAREEPEPIDLGA
jgi:hypothetical protein